MRYGLTVQGQPICDNSEGIWLQRVGGGTGTPRSGGAAVGGLDVASVDDRLSRPLVQMNAIQPKLPPDGNCRAQSADRTMSFATVLLRSSAVSVKQINPCIRETVKPNLSAVKDFVAALCCTSVSPISVRQLRPNSSCFMNLLSNRQRHSRYGNPNRRYNSVRKKTHQLFEFID